MNEKEINVWNIQMNKLQDYIKNYIEIYIMIEVVFTLIIESLDDDDYQNNKNEIIDQIYCSLIYGD